MHPAGVAEAAVGAGLDAVVVCDHNAAGNAAATVRAGRRLGLTVLPGIEVTSEEEVHILAVLPDVQAAAELESRVQEVLPGRNDRSSFGLQVIVDEHEEVTGFDEHLLAGATAWSVESVVEAIHDVGGLAVAAHVDREGFGIIGQLGMIPAGLKLDALEVSPRTSFEVARVRYGTPAGLPILTSSDAHQPDRVGEAVTFMLLEDAGYGEVRQAIEGRNGRAVLGGGRPMEDLALHILDIAQNGLEAGATAIGIELVEDPARDLLTICVRDNGRGMDQATLARVTDPFYTTRHTRRVGMGLPLLAEAARAAGGGITLDSEPGRGTRLTATFRYGHIDRAPIGDIQTTLMVFLAGNPEADVTFRHVVSEREFELSSKDLRAALGEAALTSPEGLAVLREAIRRGEADLARRGTGHEAADFGGGQHGGDRDSAGD